MKTLIHDEAKHADCFSNLRRLSQSDLFDEFIDEACEVIKSLMPEYNKQGQ
jgi:hypothetical protein